MANEQYVRSFVRSDTGAEFVFDDGYELDRDGIPGEEVPHTIPTGNTDGSDGEYQNDSRLGPRTIAFKGTINADGPSDLWNMLTTLMKALPRGKEGLLRRKIVLGDTVLQDVFLPCRVSYRAKGPESGLPYNKWEVGFRSASPLYRDWDLQSAVDLPTDGGIADVDWGGAETVLPIVTIVVTTPGTIELQEGSSDGFSVTFTAAAAGTYTFDCEQRALSFVPGGGGTPTNAVTAITSGGFFEMLPDATTLAMTLSGGAVVSSASVQARRRWPFS